MVEQEVPQPMPAAPVLQVVPPAEPTKKSSGVLRFIVILAVALLGGVGYVLYAQLSKPVEEVPVTPPSLSTQDVRPDQGFSVPTITSSDSVTDIEKDLSGMTIEAENTTEFDADLQSLE